MTVWSRNSGVAWRRVAGGAVLLPPTAEEPLVVSGAGAIVWELLGTPSDLSSLSQRIESEYGVAAEKVAVDIAPFLEELAGRSLVTASERPQ